jgi:hypothetical protein
MTMMTEQTAMPTPSRVTQERAARSAIREKRAQDAALAMREYGAERLAALAKTTRLRALRLAKEVGNAQQTKKKRPRENRY